MLTVVIPIKEQKGITQAFLESNKWVFIKYHPVVIDSGGGEALKSYSRIYIKKDIPFWEARKLGYSLVKTPFTLNLDADVIVPNGYVQGGLELLEQANIGAVSIFFEDDGAGLRPHWGTLQYGISLWRTELLKRLYDYERSNGYCECVYMWRKLEQNGFRIETLPMRAKHLK